MDHTQQTYLQLVTEFQREVELKYPGGGFAKDGPVNVSRWFSGAIPFKILFILKEAYGFEGKVNDIMDNSNRSDDSRTNRQISTLMGFLKGVLACDLSRIGNSDQSLFGVLDSVYDELGSASKDFLQNSFSDIAIIELKKTSGGTQSNDAEIREHARAFQNLLTAQINLLNSHLIICCGRVVWECLTHDLQIFEKDLRNLQSQELYLANAPIIISSCHPAYTGFNSYDLVFDICKKMMVYDIWLHLNVPDSIP